MSGNNNVGSPKINEQTIAKLKDICNIILVSEDRLDIDKAKTYIEEQIDNNTDWRGDKNEVRFYVLNSISDYIDNCPNPVQLFAFANDNKFYSFRMELTNHYYHHYYSKPNTHSSIQFPQVLNYAFDCIQEAIDTHTLFHKFSIKMTNDIVEQATKGATDASSEAVTTAKLAASKAANEAIDIVIDQVMDDKHVEKQISDKVDNHMGKVTSRISETSVTILGIFSGIVLTVVAGLFYSSSVLESINTADFYKLLCISALVGLVCLHLIVAMFRFVARIGEKSEKKFFSDWVIIVITVILLIVMTTGLVLHLKNPTQNTVIDTEESEINANVDVNISYSDIASNDVTNDSEIPETTSDSSTQ